MLETLARIRAAVGGEVVDAEGAAAVRAVLMRLFDGFILHRADSGKSNCIGLNCDLKASSTKPHADLIAN